MSEYAVRISDKNYVLLRKQVRGEKAKTPGEVNWLEEAYFGRLEHLMLRLLENKVADRIRGRETVSTQELYDALKWAQEEVRGFANQKFSNNAAGGG